MTFHRRWLGNRKLNFFKFHIKKVIILAEQGCFIFKQSRYFGFISLFIEILRRQILRDFFTQNIAKERSKFDILMQCPLLRHCWFFIETGNERMNDSSIFLVILHGRKCWDVVVQVRTHMLFILGSSFQ